MPGPRNKLLLNSRTTKGMHRAIMQQYEALDDMTTEILDNGWIDDPQSDAFRDEMRAACAEHDESDERYYHFLKDLASRMAEWMDKKRKGTP